ncbi:MAG: CtsR family transcriptional regulator [Veillonellales bacterium]
MANLADFIEQFILRKLSGEEDDIVVLRRNEIAEEIDCAPSQVSYVLSTRFTVDRGFIVESRRGSGGFVRIARIPLQEVVYNDGVEQINDTVSRQDVADVLHHFVSHGLMTGREAVLIVHFFDLMGERILPEERRDMLRSLLTALADLA